MICVRIEYSVDVPLLPPHGKCCYDSDELSLSNIQLFAGDLNSKLSARLPGTYSIEGGQATSDAMITPQFSRVGALFNQGDATKKSGFVAEEIDGDPRMPVLRGLQSIAIEDVWSRLDVDTKGSSNPSLLMYAVVDLFL
jgi:hypothetical protein